jgi:hypothetical protein
MQLRMNIGQRIGICTLILLALLSACGGNTPAVRVPTPTTAAMTPAEEDESTQEQVADADAETPEATAEADADTDADADAETPEATAEADAETDADAETPEATAEVDADTDADTDAETPEATAEVDADADADTDAEMPVRFGEEFVSEEDGLAFSLPQEWQVRSDFVLFVSTPPRPEGTTSIVITRSSTETLIKTGFFGEENQDSVSLETMLTAAGDQITAFQESQGYETTVLETKDMTVDGIEATRITLEHILIEESDEEREDEGDADADESDTADPVKHTSLVLALPGENDEELLFAFFESSIPTADEHIGILRTLIDSIRFFEPYIELDEEMSIDEGGVAFAPPSDWTVSTENMGELVAITVSQAQLSSPSPSPRAFIVNIGQPDAVIAAADWGVDTEGEDLTQEAIVENFLEAMQNDAQIRDIQPVDSITIGGVEANRLVATAEIRTRTGNVMVYHYELILAMLDDGRLFKLVSLNSPYDIFAPFLDSIRFFEAEVTETEESGDETTEDSEMQGPSSDDGEAPASENGEGDEPERVIIDDIGIMFDLPVGWDVQTRLEQEIKRVAVTPGDTNRWGIMFEFGPSASMLSVPISDTLQPMNLSLNEAARKYVESRTNAQATISKPERIQFGKLDAMSTDVEGPDDSGVQTRVRLILAVPNVDEDGNSKGDLLGVIVAMQQEEWVTDTIEMVLDSVRTFEPGTAGGNQLPSSP